MTADDTTRRTMIDHVDLLVADLEASRDFYRAALAPLGMEEQDRSETFSVYGITGVSGSADFAINLIAPGDRPTMAAHVAFVATSRAMVTAFHRAALGAGGRDKQGPAEHPEYHEGYYGAFVYDPDGNNIEAVFHDRPTHGTPPT